MALAQGVSVSVRGIVVLQKSAVNTHTAGPADRVQLNFPGIGGRVSTDQCGETRSLLSVSWRVTEQPKRRAQCRATVHKVEMIHDGQTYMLDVPEGESILTVALENGMDVPYDCNLGVCMTCPAKLEKGSVDQSGGMLSDDVIERGYALMCVAYPQTNCTIRTIPEEELLSLQLATANDA
ncbi:hypothetical protein Mapa_012960 [Marchantia paleacea]|nr:hypothetical protein Mapa_012960 [Marchantia paleacea]